PGVRVVPSPGHTPGHQSVLIDGGGTGPGAKALFLGDVVPTSVHVRLPFIMGYDLAVEDTLASKKRLFGQAIEEQWLVLFGHDRRHGATLKLDDKRQPAVADFVDL